MGDGGRPQLGGWSLTNQSRSTAWPLDDEAGGAFGCFPPFPSSSQCGRP